MEDREFFDLLYQQWSKTTGAEDKFWMPEKVEDEWDNDGLGGEWKVQREGWDVYAVDKDQIKTLVAHFENEADADFITAVHGCVADLIRRLHSALDEADRADLDKDERENNIFELAVENDELREEIARLKEGW